MKQDDIKLHLISLLRHEAKKTINKQLLLEQFIKLIDDADPTTLEFISCQLTLLQSFMGSGGKDESKN
jgi:hypothetical protein